MFDYEWAATQHNVNCRLANRVLVPDAIPPERLARYGARGSKLIRYPGLKEEYYLSDFEPDRGVLAQLGVEGAEVLNVVRTAPSYALYLGGSETPLLARVLRRAAADTRVHTVVLARTDQQRADVRALGLERVVVPERTVDGRSLVALADVLVSAGGTMNREAAVLGTPVWSMFEGPLGGVDEQLVREGRLQLLSDADAIAFEPKPAGALAERVRRDPATCSSSRCPACASASAVRLERALDGLLGLALDLVRDVVLAEAAQADGVQVAALEDLQRVDHPDRARRSRAARRPSAAASAPGPSRRAGAAARSGPAARSRPSSAPTGAGRPRCAAGRSRCA